VTSLGSDAGSLRRFSLIAALFNPRQIPPLCTRPDFNLASYGQPEALPAARASGFGLSIRCGSESAVVDLQIVANRSKP